MTTMTSRMRHVMQCLKLGEMIVTCHPTLTMQTVIHLSPVWRRRTRFPNGRRTTTTEAAMTTRTTAVEMTSMVGTNTDQTRTRTVNIATETTTAREERTCDDKPENNKELQNQQIHALLIQMGVKLGESAVMMPRTQTILTQTATGMMMMEETIFLEMTTTTQEIATITSTTTNLVAKTTTMRNPSKKQTIITANHTTDHEALMISFMLIV